MPRLYLKRCVFTLVGGLVAATLSFPSTARAQCEASEDAKLIASDPAAFSRFGRSVDAFGDLIVVGSPRVGGGVVYVYRFERGAWVEEARLTPPGASGPDFGHAVSVNGTAIIVGEPSRVNGAAYVYRLSGTGWSLQSTLSAANGAAGDRFGDAVSISGGLVVVGASGKDGAATDSGSAYIFRFDGQRWRQEAELRASDGAQRDAFGNAVSLSVDVAVVGAWNHGNRGLTFPDGPGAAYVFRFDGQVWNEEVRLMSPNPLPGERDRFGRSVSLDGDALLVGTEPITMSNRLAPAGSAYVFRRVAGRWEPESKLVAQNASPGDRFGVSVSLSGDTAVIGAWGVSLGVGCPFPRLCDDGAAYLFERNVRGWTQRARLRSSDLAQDDLFGWAVATTETFAVVGAWRDDDNGPDTGSAYVFPIVGICCYADCESGTGPGVLDIFDFLCFQNSFVNGEPYACDCDASTGPSVCDIFDFLCFQSAFTNGCP
jgi:FG-GAP repeat